MLAQLIPKLIYHYGKAVFQRFETANYRTKREPSTAITLLGVGLAGAGNVISSLMLQEKEIIKLLELL